MRVLMIILAGISAILGLILSILPFGKIALIPIIIAFILGILALNISKKEQKNTLVVKLIFTLTIIGLGLTIYRAIFDENVVEKDIETINRDKQSEQDAIEELEGIDLE